MVDPYDDDDELHLSCRKATIPRLSFHVLYSGIVAQQLARSTQSSAGENKAAFASATGLVRRTIMSVDSYIQHLLL